MIDPLKSPKGPKICQNPKQTCKNSVYLIYWPSASFPKNVRATTDFFNLYPTAAETTQTAISKQFSRILRNSVKLTNIPQFHMKTINSIGKSHINKIPSLDVMDGNHLPNTKKKFYDGVIKKKIGGNEESIKQHLNSLFIVFSCLFHNKARFINKLQQSF